MKSIANAEIRAYKDMLDVVRQPQIDILSGCLQESDAYWQIARFRRIGRGLMPAASAGGIPVLMETAQTRLPAPGEIPWGSHFCQFYHTADDLADVLAPFFKAGLENNEQCIWVASAPFDADAARAALAAVLLDLDERLVRGQIQILDFSEWYTRGGQRGIDAVLDDRIARKEQALARGYTGLRVSGDICWI